MGGTLTRPGSVEVGPVSVAEVNNLSQGRSQEPGRLNLRSLHWSDLIVGGGGGKPCLTARRRRPHLEAIFISWKTPGGINSLGSCAGYLQLGVAAIKIFFGNKF